MTIFNKTFRLNKKGRKYWAVTIMNGRHEFDAKLIDNEATRTFAPGVTVTLPVVDRTKRNRYGAEVMFEPMTADQVRAEREREAAAERRREAERWLGYAERDAAADRSYKSNAVQMALALVPAHPALAVRLTALRARVEANKQYWAEVTRQEVEAKAKRRRELDARRVLYADSDAPPLNTPVKYGNRLVVFESTGKSFRINDDHPSYEGSHLLGHEGEFGSYHYFREATAAEVAAYEESERQRKEKEAKEQAVLRAIERIRRHIVTTGEYPRGEPQPVGVRLIVRKSLYGGGSSFLVTPEWIWSIYGNSADGDDWSRNNVIGGIGYRIPYDQLIAEDLYSLDKGILPERPESDPEPEPEPEAPADPEATDDRYVTPPTEEGGGGQGRAPMSAAERQKRFRQNRDAKLKALKDLDDPSAETPLDFVLEVLDRAVRKADETTKARLYEALMLRAAEIKPQRQTDPPEVLLKWRADHLAGGRGVRAMPRWECKVGPYTLVVSDQRLPDENGIETGSGWVTHVKIWDVEEGLKLIGQERLLESQAAAQEWCEAWVRKHYIDMRKSLGG